MRTGGSSQAVRRPRAGGRPATPGAAGGPTITFRGKSPALLVARQDGANLFRPGQSLMDFHAGPAWVGENSIDTFTFKTSHEDLASGHHWAKFGAFGRV